MNLEELQKKAASQRAKMASDDPEAAATQAQELVFEQRDLDPANDPKSTVSSRKSRMSRLNGIFAACLIGVVLLAPIPLGSNRPVPWAAWATVLALLSALYVGFSIRRIPDRKFQSARYSGLFLLAGVGLLAIAAQLLPFGAPIDALPSLRYASISIAPDATLLGMMRMASYGMLFFLMLEVGTQRRRIRRMSWVLFVGLVVHAVWALAVLKLLGGNFFWGEKTAYLDMATGTFINRNSFATFMGMGCVLGVALIAGQHQKPEIRMPNRPRFLPPRTMELATLLVCLLMMVAALMATQSRMGAVSTGLGVFVTYVLIAAQQIGWRKSLMRGLAGGAVIVAVVLVIWGQGLVERSIFALQQSGTRLTLWQQSLAMIADRPLTGFGLDSFYPAFEMYHQPGLASSVIWEYAHSTYLTLWIELGLIAGSLPIAAGIWVGVILLRKSRATTSVLPPAALGVLVLAAVHSLADFSLEISGNVFLFLAILGLGLANPRQTPGSGDRPSDAS